MKVAPKLCRFKSCPNYTFGDVEADSIGIKPMTARKDEQIYFYLPKDLVMKKIIMLFVAILFATPMFSQTDELTLTGWRQNFVTSYCDEYDMMVGDKGYWILRWGTSREAIRGALTRDGFTYTETDTTISWYQNSIYKCELQFNANQKLNRTMFVVTVPIKNGIEISNSLKKKFDAVYGVSGKFKMIGTSSSYSWLDNRCGNKPIYSLQANTLVNSSQYIVTVIASRIGE